MSLATNLQSAFTRIGTEFKTIRTLITGSGTGDLSGLTTSNKTSIVAAINEAAGAGGASALDQLSDVAVTTPVTGHILRHNGTEFVNVDGTTIYQPVDADLTAIAALAGQTTYGRQFLTLVDNAALTGRVSASSETVAGKVELATAAETATGTDTTRAIHPAGAKATYQPLSANLTSLAGVASTTYGRAFLGLADQAALMALIPAATELASGKVELATSAETTTGTDTTRATHPAGVAAAISAAINGLIDTAPGTLDTLNELATALGDDPNFAATVNTALANRVRVDASQAFTAPQQAQARTNIDAAQASAVGDTNTDFVATFVAALA